MAIYAESQGLREALGRTYFPSISVGLHVGWGIEGAIGSRFKIDASYLSANVNLARRVEEATKIFRVPLLLSSSVKNCLSSKFKELLRRVDRVILKGSQQPIGRINLTKSFTR